MSYLIGNWADPAAEGARGKRLLFGLSALVEQVLLAVADLPVTVLRLPAVYGPGDAQHRLRPYLQRMLDGRPGILLHEGQAAWRWTRGYVRNLVTTSGFLSMKPWSTRLSGSGRRLMGVEPLNYAAEDAILPSRLNE
jgi:hypothetical protein